MYKVKFKNKDKIIIVQKGESILSKSNDEGLDIPFACLQGMCTTCIATILEGKTSYIEEPDLCLLYTSPSPRDKRQSRMPSSA